MSDVELVHLTQIVEVESTSQSIDLLEQRIVVDATDSAVTIIDSPITVDVEQGGSSVSVINAGPPGPRGYSTAPANDAQAAFQKAYGLEQKTISYVDGLPSTVNYFSDNVLTYVSTIVYVNALPSVVTLMDQQSNETFEKRITYSDGLPTSVEWLTV